MNDILPIGSTPLVSMPFGSHLYGTSSPKSDRDFKGVFLPPIRSILTGNIPKSICSTTGPKDAKNRPGDVDVEWYSIHYFLKLACEGQTVAIDMLHAPLSMLIEPSEDWQYLHEHRHEFYTKNLQAFVGYCRRQAAKYGVKGSRLAAVRTVIAKLEEYEAVPETRLAGIFDEIHENEHVRKLQVERRVFLDVCGRRLEDTISVTQALEPLRRFAHNYGSRAELAAANEGIDWKAVSHALRAAYQLRAIYTKGDIVFPLPEAEYLRKVKNGELDYLSEVAPALEAAMVEIADLSEKSELPEKVDRERWNDWLALMAVRRWK